MPDRDTGVVVEKTLEHEGEAVRRFHASITLPVVVGIEATGSMFCGWGRRPGRGCERYFSSLGNHEIQIARKAAYRD
jgi:hypothetical protein